VPLDLSTIIGTITDDISFVETKFDSLDGLDYVWSYTIASELVRQSARAIRKGLVHNRINFEKDIAGVPRLVDQELVATLKKADEQLEKMLNTYQEDNVQLKIDVYSIYEGEWSKLLFEYPLQDFYGKARLVLLDILRRQQRYRKQ
jgi:hypothetical protein